MSKSYNDDEPIFSKSNNSDESLEKQKLNLEKLKTKQENEHKKNIVIIAKRTIFWILVFMGSLVLIDMLFQRFEFDNSIVSECMSVAKYALTTVLGFLFASNTK